MNNRARYDGVHGFCWAGLEKGRMDRGHAIIIMA